MMATSEVSLKEKIGYGLGDAASSMFWKIFSFYLAIFYTDIFGYLAVCSEVHVPCKPGFGIQPTTRSWEL